MSLCPLWYLFFRVVRNFVFGSCESARTHDEVKNCAIILRTSESVLVVSSKPGVSTRTTFLPSIKNGSVATTTSVHDLRPPLVSKLEPDRRLMNCQWSRS